MHNEDNNNNSNPIGALMYILTGFLLISIVSSLFTLNLGANRNQEINTTPKFDTVTIETYSFDTIFRAKRIVETYDKNGKLSFTVTFNSNDMAKDIVCNIPEKYKDNLNKDATYAGEITVSYVKEYYDEILKNNAYETLEKALILDTSAREISNVNFMFKGYLETAIKSTSDIKNELESKFLSEYKEENITDETK